MENKVLAWISEVVKGGYNESLLDQSVRALNIFAESSKNINWSKRITSMFMSSEETKELQLKNFADIEIFMKDLLQLTQPDVLKKRPEKLKEDEKNPSWTLAHLYKQAFEVVGMDVRLSKKGSFVSSVDEKRV